MMNEDLSPVEPARPLPLGRQRRRPCLLNRTEVRKFILETIGKTRPGLRITRVSAETLEVIDHWLRQKLRAEVHRHPSLGRTADTLDALGLTQVNTRVLARLVYLICQYYCKCTTVFSVSVCAYIGYRIQLDAVRHPAAPEAPATPGQDPCGNPSGQWVCGMLRGAHKKLGNLVLPAVSLHLASLK